MYVCALIKCALLFYRHIYVFVHVVYVCVDMYVHECVCVFVYVVCMFVCGICVYVHVCV